MKTILFLAVLLFAAQSSPLHEVYRGFILNLPMNATVQTQFLNSGFDCINSFEGVLINLIGSLQKDIPAKNYFDILRNVLVADDVLEHKIAPQCFVVYQQLVQYFNQSGVIIEEPRYWDYCNTTGRNFSSWENQTKFYNECWNAWDKVLSVYYLERNIKGAKIVETYAHIVQDVLSQRFYSIGENVANVLKLSNNMIKPSTHIVFNNSQNVPYSQERFIFEFIPALLEELGLIENKNQTLSCLVDLFNTTQKALSNPHLYRGDAFTATHAFLEGALEITDSVHRCAEHVNLSLNGTSRLAYIFTHYPAKAVLKMFSNYFLNLADEIATQNNWRMLMINGDYIESGREYAKHIKIALKDLVF